MEKITNDFENLPEEEKKEIENRNYDTYPERKRVDKLRSEDHHYEDSAKELAEKEDEFRKKFKESFLKIIGVNESMNELEDDLANKFSDQVFENIENNRKAFIDPLTKIGNRGFLEETIPKFLTLGKREEKESTVIMLDIDHFKSVNDTKGHAEGDRALKEISAKIKESIRESDFVFRYGGEEFTVFLPNTNIEQAKVIVEKIRKNVEEAKILDRTISLGYVSTENINDDDKNNVDMKNISDILLKKADKALYHSKERGRNQATIYSEELEGERK